MCTHACTCTHRHTHVLAAFMHIPVHTHACWHMCVCRGVHICGHVRVCAGVCWHVHGCVQACAHACAGVCLHRPPVFTLFPSAVPEDADPRPAWAPRRAGIQPSATRQALGRPPRSGFKPLRDANAPSLAAVEESSFSPHAGTAAGWPPPLSIWKGRPRCVERCGCPEGPGLRRQSRVLGRQGVGSGRHSPGLLTGAGTCGLVALVTARGRDTDSQRGSWVWLKVPRCLGLRGRPALSPGRPHLPPRLG